MTCDFTLMMPDWPERCCIATIRVLENRNEFLTECIFLGYHPPKEGETETRGMTFNSECSKTGAKHAFVLFNGSDMDIELIVHEIRHAYFWAMSNHHGAVKVNLLNEVEEEAFCARLDVLINRTISTIEAHLGHTLVWRKGKHATTGTIPDAATAAPHAG